MRFRTIRHKDFTMKISEKLSFGMYSVKYFGEQIWVPMLGYRWKSVYATIPLYAIGLQESKTTSGSILNCLKESPQIFSTCYSAVISHLSAAVKGAVSLTWYWSLSHQEPRNEVRSLSLTKSSVGFGPVTFQFQCNALPHQATPSKGKSPQSLHLLKNYGSETI